MRPRAVFVVAALALAGCATAPQRETNLASRLTATVGGEFSPRAAIYPESEGE